ncbi:hypothetical protein F2Q68_00027241 [Brassica cretica]|uniref:Uncharacterized protein n=1 Tax=Brassica cretica TaxID=69181 RepID=A0A8S9IHU7_BRACR|nr:hypothetical protein F2Q68_00027241 [Brassica cretica]
MNPMSRSRTDFETRTDFSFETRTDEADFSFEASTHEITWRMFLTQLWNSSNKNQIKWSSDERVMQFTKPVIFSSREFGPYGSSSPRLDPYHHGPERPE